MDLGKKMLGRRHVLPSVVSSLHEIQVEGTFKDGTYLVTVHNPISSEEGDLKMALYGSFLPVPDDSVFGPVVEEEVYEYERQPGAVVAVRGVVTLNEGRKRVGLKVTNKGDRPVQVCILNSTVFLERWWQTINMSYHIKRNLSAKFLKERCKKGGIPRCSSSVFLV